MITTNEAAKSAVKDDYSPQSTVDALLDEIGDLHRRIKSLKKTNREKLAVIAYLEKRR